MKRKILAGLMSAVIAVSGFSFTAFGASHSGYGKHTGEIISDSMYNTLLKYSNGTNDALDGYEVMHDLLIFDDLPYGRNSTGAFGWDLLMFTNQRELAQIFELNFEGLREDYVSADGFDYCVVYEFYISQNLMYNCVYSLLDNPTISMADAMDKAGVPKGTEVAAVRFHTHVHIPEYLKGTSHWDKYEFTMAHTKSYAYAISPLTLDDEGWYTIRGNKYYVKDNGKLAMSPTIIDGVAYNFDKKTGALTGTYSGRLKTNKGYLFYSDGELLTNRWVKYKDEKYYAGRNGVIDEWGVGLSVKSVSETGLKLKITHHGGDYDGKLKLGGDFYIQKKVDGKWKKLKVKKETSSDKTYTLTDGKFITLKQNWKSMYGSLSEGEYLIVKEITDYVSKNKSETKKYYAYFEIED